MFRPTIVPSDAIWRHRSGSTLAQVMACYLTAQLHNPNNGNLWYFCFLLAWTNDGVAGDLRRYWSWGDVILMDMGITVSLWGRLHFDMETFPHELPFVRGTLRLQLASPYKSQYCGALFWVFFSWYESINMQSRVASDLKRHNAHVTSLPWQVAPSVGAHFAIYHQTTNIRRTKFQNFNVSRLVLQLLLPNSLKPGIKSRMKM